MTRLRCWWRSHPLAEDFTVVMTHAGESGVGVVVRRCCLCGSKARLGYAVELER